MSSRIRYVPGDSPLVLDSPHSGTAYPDDFGFSAPLALLRRAEDTHVEALYDFAAEYGAAWIEALFPRSYLDANRALDELDPALLDSDWPDALPTDPARLAKVKLGKGLIWGLLDEAEPIYSRKLSVLEVQARIQSCWRPYYAALEDAIGRARAAHPYVIHLNCHSMPAVAGKLSTGFPGEAHADFVLGNRDHTTSSAVLLEALGTFLQSLGYSVALNHPYKGVELVRRFSDPAKQIHSIQVEVNRKLYMNELTLERTASFVPLQSDLRRMLGFLAEYDPR